MGQSSSRHQQQSQDFSENPQPPAPASRGGASNSGNDGPPKDVDNSQTVPSSFEPSALKAAALKKDGEYFVESEANMAAMKGRVTALESALRDWNDVMKIFGYFGLIVLGLKSVEIVSTRAYPYIKPRGFKPSLVRETTRLLARDVIFHPIKTLKNSKKKTSGAHNNVVLSSNVEKQLEKITSDAKASEENNGSYQRLLMHGPRGTGKTMAAKKLAQDLGMVYASTSGYSLPIEYEASDPDQIFGKYGEPAINELFDWASTSKKGVLLFVDSADDFLKKKSREDTSWKLEDMQKAFLRRTSKHCKEVMVVLATEAEQPVWLDGCQFDKTVKFELPGVEERKRMIELYVKEYVQEMAVSEKRSYDVQVLEDEGLYLEMAKMTEGFSGSRLESLAGSVACSAFDDGVFREMAIENCQWAVESYEGLMGMTSGCKTGNEKRESKSSTADSDNLRDSATLAPEVLPNGAGVKPEGMPTA